MLLNARKELGMHNVLIPPEQLQLFQPPRVVPVWNQLPSDVREEVKKHLSRMLREHREHDRKEETLNEQ